MIPFYWVSASLHYLHDTALGPTNNPWIDHLKHVYHDEDHLFSLTPVSSILIGVIAIPCYASYSAFFTWRRRCQQQQQQEQPSKKAPWRAILTILILLLALYLQDELGHEWVQTEGANHGPGLVNLITGDSPRLQALLDKCPLLKRGPRPPIWFSSNRHLQFVPWILQNIIHQFPGIPFERHEFVVTDCLDKSVPHCEPHDAMNDTITLDIFPRFDENSTTWGRDAPVVLIAPGLRSHSQDLPSNSILRALYGRGFRSVVVNRRGHTPGTVLQAPRWNLFGDVDDLEQVYWHIKNDLIEPNTPMFLHGISSGCAVVVSALGAWDKRSQQHPELRSPKFVASAALTPGYDTSKVLQPDRFKWPYNPLMSMAVKDHFLEQNKDILRAYNSTAYDNAMAASSLQEILNASAPFAGYPDAASYYDHTNPVNDMHFIETPTYVLNSVDDPCCRIENLYETSPFSQHAGRTYADIIDTSSNGIVSVTRTGSHCPFLDGRFYPFVTDPFGGGIMLNSFADQSFTEFYLAALQVYNDRRFL